MGIKQKNLTIIGSSLVVILLIAFFIIQPTVNYIKNLKEQIRAEREELERRYQRILYLKKNTNNLQELENKLSVLDDFFLIPGEELELITAFEDIADKNRVEQKIDPKEVNLDNPKQTTLPFVVSVSGKTSDVINYLLGLEQLSYYINFNSLNIISQGTSGRQFSSQLPEVSETGQKINMVLNSDVYLLKL